VLTIGALASAVGAIIALAPKSPPPPPPPPSVLEARFGSVTAYPDVSLNQFDARAGEGEGSPQPAKTGEVPYSLLADVLNTPRTLTTTSTETTTPPVGSSGEATQTTTNAPASTTSNIPTSSTQSTTSTSAALRYVSGARIENGTGAPARKVTAVLNDLSKPSGGGGERGEEPTSSEPPTGTSTSRTDGATTTTSAAPAPPRVGMAPSAEIELPESCSSSCGATQEIDLALTYNPDPAKAADAVAELFTDSRADIIHHKLYPVGVVVSYTVALDGFAHDKALLKWSLWSQGEDEALPRRWWRNVTVAQITPTVNRESISGEFWVPIPPARGDYTVHLVLDDDKGIAHAHTEASPPIH
jgi:hypothetical protein